MSIDPDLLLRAVSAGQTVAREGRVASYIPELSRSDPSWVALAVCGLSGECVSAGDSAELFSLQSVSKVFALARVLQASGDSIFDKVSMEPSGDSFHSIVRLEEESGRPRNPLINAGAIVVSEHLEGDSAEQRINNFQRFLREVAGTSDTTFSVNQPVFESESATGFRNRALAHYMKHHDIVRNPELAVDTYFRQCAVQACVAEVAQAGLFLANDGLNPVSGERTLSVQQNRTVLALMSTCGLYDECGRFAVRVGIPAKSGVSGVILGIVPGRYSIACYGPALGAKGNSVAGMAMLEFLAAELDLSIF